MRSLKSKSLLSFLLLVVALSVPQLGFAQYTIDTIAGGGPNGLPALKTSTGYPESVAFDSAGNLYIANSYASQVLEVSTAGTVTVVAGNGTAGYSGDGGPATSAALGADGPQGIFVDGSGDIFIADTENSVIREVVASTGDIQTVAGTSYDAAGGGSACQSSGDGGPALSAYLCLPYSVFVDSVGDIFIADFGNSTIREVAASTGDIQTIAGTPGTPGYVDGVLATSAQLDLPGGVYLDAAGNIFISDTFNSVIRVVNPSAQPVTIAGISIPAGFIQTVAGTQYNSGDGTTCQSTNAFCLPFGLFVDSSDDIYVADYANLAIREVNSSGSISTVAGTIGTLCANYNETNCGDGGAATSAQLNYPSDVILDASGDIYIADTDDFTVREVTTSNGNIQAFAGNATLAYSGDGGSPTNAELNGPGSVFVDASGNVYIADTYNSVIRFVNNGGSPYTVPGTTAVIQAGDIGTVTGNGIAGYSGDGGLATSAELNSPQGVFVDSQGDIFIADSGNNVIREVVASTGDIQTVVGNGTQGFVDGVAPLSAELNDPYAVAVDLSGNIFIADTDNDVIRVVNVGTAALTFGPISVPASTILTVAGTPQLACDSDQTSTSCGDGNVANTANTVYLSFPADVALDSSDDFFIADTFDFAIRKVSQSTGVIQTVAGTIQTSGFAGDSGLATSALLDSPYGVFLDSSSDIFIADSDNAAIREVVASTGFIQTIAGIPATSAGFPTPGFSGDGGPATNAELNAPSGVFVTSAGKVVIADTDNSRIRELAAAAFSVTVAPATATVVINAIQQFTATVTGNSNTGVNWFVNGVAGGNSTVGTISTSGLFTAPAVVPSPATVTISAVSQVDNTTTGSAQATIANPSSTVTVAVSSNPSGVTQVYTGTVQPFTATVTGSTNTAVTWYVEGQQGGSTTFGTIDTSGNYTAPSAVPSQPNVVIEAVSQADTTGIGTASIALIAAPSGSTPTAQTVSPGGTANFSVSITGSAGPTLTLQCSSSSLPSGASCSFSPSTISSGTHTYTLAVSVPSTSASLHNESRPSIAPQLYVAFIPLAGILLFGIRRSSRGIGWIGLALLTICLLAFVACGGGGNSSTGGNPVIYNIQIQAKANAQLVNITTASLTVQ
jgi:trimeric autotransporter adhesin